MLETRRSVWSLGPTYLTTARRFNLPSRAIIASVAAVVAALAVFRVVTRVILRGSDESIGLDREYENPHGRNEERDSHADDHDDDCPVIVDDSCCQGS